MQSQQKSMNMKMTMQINKLNRQYFNSTITTDNFFYKFRRYNKNKKSHECCENNGLEIKGVQQM